ncbi:MAG TPA: class D sortase [Bryobacteraceae bacterium]|nr:class D sortase [Bryobacteraceae bacterium]
MKTGSSENRIRAWTKTTLLATGLIGVGLWIGSNAVPAVWQSWDNWAFDREVRGEPATATAFLTEKRQQIAGAVAKWLGLPAPAERPRPTQPPLAQSPPPGPPQLENNALIGRLSVPRLHLNTTVREGTGRDTLTLAAGHIPGTALPGATGNVAVAGHRDTLFLGLAEIRKKDWIRFDTLQGRYEYQVASTRIVRPRDVGVLRAGAHPELTLVTCYPFNYIGSAPDRFIVKARLVSAIPLQPSSPSEVLQDAPTASTEPAGPSGDLARRDTDTENGLFSVVKHHSRELAPGISLGVDDTNVESGQVTGWMWIMPDRRTIWLRDQPAQRPLIFYQRGERRELLITNVTSNSVTGYLRAGDRAPAR